MRKRARVDGNHKLIAEALTHAGAAVCSLAPVGAGVPDLLVGYVAKSGPKAAVVEVKMPKGRLTPDQVKWRCWWIGPFTILCTVDEALRWLQAERQR